MNFKAGFKSRTFEADSSKEIIRKTAEQLLEDGVTLTSTKPTDFMLMVDNKRANSVTELEFSTSVMSLVTLCELEKISVEKAMDDIAGTEGEEIFNLEPTADPAIQLLEMMFGVPTGTIDEIFEKSLEEKTSLPENMEPNKVDSWLENVWHSS